MPKSCLNTRLFIVAVVFSLVSNVNATSSDIVAVQIPSDPSSGSTGEQILMAVYNYVSEGGLRELPASSSVGYDSNHPDQFLDPRLWPQHMDMAASPEPEPGPDPEPDINLKDFIRTSTLSPEPPGQISDNNTEPTLTESFPASSYSQAYSHENSFAKATLTRNLATIHYPDADTQEYLRIPELGLLDAHRPEGLNLDISTCGTSEYPSFVSSMPDTITPKVQYQSDAVVAQDPQHDAVSTGSSQPEMDSPQHMIPATGETRPGDPPVVHAWAQDPYLPLDRLSRPGMTPIVDRPRRARHPRQKDGFPCDHEGCSEVFSTSRNRNLHRRKHRTLAERPYPCHWPGCGHACNSKKELQRHTSDRHTHEDYVNCPHCSREGREDNIRRHIGRSHRDVVIHQPA